MHTVKRLFKVNKGCVNRCVPFVALLQDLAYSKNLIVARFTFSKASLFSAQQRVPIYCCGYSVGIPADNLQSGVIFFGGARKYSSARVSGWEMGEKRIPDTITAQVFCRQSRIWTFV